MRNVGIDYILLGSDFPQLTLTQAVEALEKLPLTAEEKQKIRFKNAQRLLFPGEERPFWKYYMFIPKLSIPKVFLVLYICLITI
jgi:hypothetical protein